jgi:hypothetical protein
VTCPDCTASRICTGKYRLYSPSCLYCGARLLQQIPAHSGTTAEASQRRKAVLADWVAQGHQEAELRALVAGPLAYEPITKEKK